MAGWEDTIQDDIPMDDKDQSWESSIQDDPEVAPKSPDVSMIESGIRGLAQGASMGFADELTGGAEALWDKAIKGDKRALSELYAMRRDESRANYKAAEEANPGTYMSGQVGGAVGTTLVPGLGGANIAKLGVMGAAQGLGSSEADLTEGDVSGALRDTAIGGVTGLATGGLVKGASSLAPRVLEEVATSPLVDKVVKLDPTKRATSFVNSVLKDAIPEGPIADTVTGAIGRKLTYSNPISGTIQGISDAARVAQKSSQVAVESIIPRMGKFSQLLQNAAQRGGTSLAATDFVLQQNNPEYRELRKAAIDEDEGISE